MAGTVEVLSEAGQPLEELVRGSLNYTLDAIDSAWREQFAAEREDDWSLWIVEVFADYVIVRSRTLPTSHYYQVTYKKDGESFVFADKDDWTVVELAYAPRSIQEQIVAKDTARRFEETVGEVHFLDEAAAQANEAGPWPIRAIGITANVVNENRRRYKPHVLVPAVQAVASHLHESAGQGRAKQLYGEVEHPNMKATRRPFLTEVCVNWTDINFDGRQILLEGKLLGTQVGKDIRAQMLGGVVPGISQRAYGQSEYIEENDVEIEEVTRLVITGYDLTVEPSDPAGSITYFESTQPRQNKETNMPPTNDNETPNEGHDTLNLTTLQAAHPDLVEALIEQHEEQKRLEEAERERLLQEKERERQQIVAEATQELRTKLGLSETDDLEQVLAERETRREALEREQCVAEVRSFVESEVNGITGYPDWAKKNIIDEVQALALEAKDEASKAIKDRRRYVDGMLAQLKRNAMGDATAMRVLGPVIEGVTGQPAYAEPAILLVESLVNQGLQPDFRDGAAPLADINARFAHAYTEAFDQAYKHHLIQESRMFSEAEQASDLSLPYSVMRAVMAQAVPQLVATTVFDVQMTDEADVRIYYETYSGETGESVTLTIGVDHINLTSDESAWVNLETDAGLHVKRIVPGSWDVQPSGGGTSYVEGTDYVIDPANGTFYTVPAADGGNIGDSTALDIGLQYRAIRKGDMAEIEEAKTTLSFVLVSMAADRLATQISRDAIVLSRGAMGYDATGRTIAMLVRQVQKYIDASLIGLALTASLSVVANAGVTWASSSETVNALVEKIGTAKVKIINRYFDPTAILMSATNAEIASNWDGFSAAGERPDALLNANGFIGRLKGLPLVQSTEMLDTYILVLNREIVHHRVLQPAQLMGPYHSVGTNNKLVAADRYYIEEFNAQASPVKTKAAHVKVS